MQLIQHITVDAVGGAASLTFSNIPQTFDDLLVVYSMRSSGLSQGRQVSCRFNNTTANLSSRALYSASNGSPTTYSTTDSAFGMYPGSADTANSFSSQSLYLPSYKSAVPKTFSIDSVYGNNGQVYLAIIAGLWNDTSAISQISLFNSDGSNVWTQNSIVSLYGITRGSSGGVVVS